MVEIREGELGRYDAIVIGAGQAGVPLSIALAKAGWKTALVEREHVGGTCINEGCTPTKTMVASGRVAYLARRGAEYGAAAQPVCVDLSVVRQRKRDIVESFRSGSERRLTSTEGLQLICGEATFAGPKTVAVRANGGPERRLTAERIIINAGARPAIPRLPGIERVPILNSTSIMELDRVPEHLLVLGGGYIGLEFGQLFRRFGSRVTIVQRAPQLLPLEDADIADEVLAIMREDGVEVLLQSEAVSVEKDGTGVRLSVGTSGGNRVLTGSHLLAAAGRTPNTDRLNLAATGVVVSEQGFIQVNDRLETNVPGIYALGDIKGGPAFTHISYDDYRIIRDNLLHGGSRHTGDRPVPYTVFIDPQLGRVGLTEREARKRGLNIRVAKMPMTYVARALEMSESRGLMKAIVDADSGRILGCAILGIEGGEIMAMVQLAMMGGLSSQVLRETVFAHPTLAEGLNNLFA